MVKAGILAYEDGKFQVLRDDLHLPAQGAIYAAYRLLIRARAMTRLMTAVPKSDYNFAVFFSTDTETRLEIQRRFLIYIKEVQTLVAASTPTEVFQMNFDLLQWSKPG